MAATDIGKVGIVAKGDYNSASTYEVLDAVSYNNGLYIAKQAVPAGTLPTNTTYWQAAVNPAALNNYFLPILNVNIAGNVPTTEELAAISWSGPAQVINFISSNYVRAIFIGCVRGTSAGQTGAGIITSYYGDKFYYARVSSGTWTMTSMNIP